MDQLANGGERVLLRHPDEARWLEPGEFVTFDFIQGRVVVNRQNGIV